MSFFDDLKKKAQGLAAQINPLDHGATYSTTVNQPRIQTPQIQQPSVQTPRLQVQSIQTPRIQTPSFTPPRITTPTLSAMSSRGFGVNNQSRNVQLNGPSFSNMRNRLQVTSPPVSHPLPRLQPQDSQDQLKVGTTSYPINSLVHQAQLERTVPQGPPSNTMVNVPWSNKQVPYSESLQEPEWYRNSLPRDVQHVGLKQVAHKGALKKPGLLQRGFEALTPVDEGAQRSANYSRAIAAQQVKALGNKAHGIYANPQVRQSFVSQNMAPIRTSAVQQLSDAGDALNEATRKTIIQPMITRPAAEVVQTARQAITHKPASYTPGSQFEKELFGDAPVASIQKKVEDQYGRQSTSSNPVLRLASRPLAAAEAAVSVANDIPVVGAALKGAKAVASSKLAEPVVAATKSAKQATDRIDPAVRELDSHYTQLNQQWQKSSAQGRKDIEKAIQANRAHRDEITRTNIGASTRRVSDTGPEELPINNRPASNPEPIAAPTNRGMPEDEFFQTFNPMNPSYPSPELTRMQQTQTRLPRLQTRLSSDSLSGAGMPEGRTPQSVGEILSESSSINKSTNGAGTQLPEFDTKKTGFLDKAFRSNRSLIERQGESGKQLANMLQGSRDSQELHLAEIEKQLPTVMKLAKGKATSLSNKEYENFVDATQGLAKPVNTQVEQAIKEWQATHPAIRQRAEDAGLDVGNLGQNYYPHFIDYDRIFKDKNKLNLGEKNMYNASINHLVETGQAQSAEEAVQLLEHAKGVSRNREFGNLEASRLIDLPFYDKTPNSLISYLNGSAKRIAHTETFGAKDEKALSLITNIAKERGDAEAAKNAFDISVGAKNYSPTNDRILGNARKFTTTTRLGLGALTNVSQSVNTGVVTGHLNTLMAATKQLSPEAREFAKSTGVISDAVLSDLRSQKGDTFSGKVLGEALKKITAPGFGVVERFNRSLAATAGRDYALRLAQKGDEATLHKLGVTGDIKGKTLSEAQQIQAARKVVEKTQFKVDAQDLPGWTDSPGGKLVAQFRTFSYKQGSFVSNEIIKPALHGNAMPLARYLIAAPTVGVGLYETRRAIDGRPEETNAFKKGNAVISKVGGLGLGSDLITSLAPLNSQYLPADRGKIMAISALSGPTVGTAINGIGSAYDLIQRKNTPTDTSRLEGKIALGVGDKYTDATGASRFALQQIPAVGTPLSNRVLPYKKESDADTGRSTSSNGVSTSPRMTADQAVKVAFTTPEAKKFLALGPADQKALAATDPEAHKLYDQINATKTAFKAPALYSSGLSPESTRTLDKYSRLTDAGKQKFEADFNNAYNLKMAQIENKQKSGSVSADETYKLQRDALPYQLAKQAGAKTSKDFKDYQDSPLGKFETMDQQYQLDKKNDKISAIDDYQIQDKLFKAQVQAPYSKEAVDVMGMSEKRILDYLGNNKITDDQYNELKKLDAANVSAGVYKYSKLDGSSGGKGGGGGGGKKSTASKIAAAEAALPRAPSFKFDAGSHFGKYTVSTRKRKGGTKVKTIARNPKVRVA